MRSRGTTGKLARNFIRAKGIGSAISREAALLWVFRRLSNFPDVGHQGERRVESRLHGVEHKADGGAERVKGETAHQSRSVCRPAQTK